MAAPAFSHRHSAPCRGAARFGWAEFSQNLHFFQPFPVQWGGSAPAGEKRRHQRGPQGPHQGPGCGEHPSKGSSLRGHRGLIPKPKQGSFPAAHSALETSAAGTWDVAAPSAPSPVPIPGPSQGKMLGRAAEKRGIGWRELNEHGETPGKMSREGQRGAERQTAPAGSAGLPGGPANALKSHPLQNKQ